MAWLALTPLGSPAVAQRANSPTIVDIGPCVSVESAVERLDCYDALARGARASTHEPAPSSPVPVAPRANAPVQPDPTEPKAEPAPTRERERDAAPSEAAADEIVSTVARLREIQPGRLEIELANGQVWRQTSSDRYRLQVGFEVRVYPTRFGGHHRLTAPTLRGFVQVDRVR